MKELSRAVGALSGEKVLVEIGFHMLAPTLLNDLRSRKGSGHCRENNVWHICGGCHKLWPENL